jgi:MFS family permease
MSNRWWCLGALTFARAAMGFQFQAVATVGPLVAGSLGLDKGQLGWLVGLYLLPGAIIALPGGLLGRRFGDKRLVLVGLALMGIGGIWLGFSQSFAEANAARGLSGIGAVMLNVLVTKMVADLFDGKERLLAMSILINSWPIGIGVALLVVGQLGQHEGWQWGMFATAVFAVIGLLGVAAIYRAPDGAAPAATSGLGLETLTRSDWHRLLLGSLPWLLYNASFQIMMSFMPSFFVDNGLALTRATGLTAVSAVGFVLGVQAGGLLLKRSAHPDRICHAALAGLCLALLALSTGTAPPAVGRPRRSLRRPSSGRVGVAAGRGPTGREPQRRDGHLLHRLLRRLRHPAGDCRFAVRPCGRRSGAVDGGGSCVRVHPDPQRVPQGHASGSASIFRSKMIWFPTRAQLELSETLSFDLASPREPPLPNTGKAGGA